MASQMCKINFCALWDNFSHSSPIPTNTLPPPPSRAPPSAKNDSGHKNAVELTVLMKLNTRIWTTPLLGTYKRNIFQRGQSHFSWSFPGMKCFFPVENSHFGRPETNFSGFEKWKAQKQKQKRKKVLSSFWFCNFSLFLLPFSIFITFPFSSFLFFFLLHFPFFPCLFFSERSAEISRSEASGGSAPPACYATALSVSVLEGCNIIVHHARLQKHQKKKGTCFLI